MSRLERVGLTLFLVGLYISILERFDAMLVLPLFPDHIPVIAIPFIGIGVILFILY